MRTDSGVCLLQVGIDCAAVPNLEHAHGVRPDEFDPHKGARILFDDDYDDKARCLRNQFFDGAVERLRGMPERRLSAMISIMRRIFFI